VTPKPPAGRTPLANNKAGDDAKADDKAPEREHSKAPQQTDNEAPAPPAASRLSPSSHVVMPTSITVAHGGRLLDGEFFAQSRRIDCHLFLRPTFGADVLRCVHCGSAPAPPCRDHRQGNRQEEPRAPRPPADAVTARPRAREPAEVWADTPAAPP
jgi:hypothetical protein